MKSRLLLVQDWGQMVKAAGYRPCQMARLCQVSLRQLERYFHEDQNITLTDFIEQLRLQEGIRLLQEKRCVKEVAFELGFKHPSHFIRKFKACFHCTPLEFTLEVSGSDRRR